MLVLSLLYLLFRRALAVASLRLRSREFKELEIAVLRHELGIFSGSLPPIDPIREACAKKMGAGMLPAPTRASG